MTDHVARIFARRRDRHAWPRPYYSHWTPAAEQRRIAQLRAERAEDWRRAIASPAGWRIAWRQEYAAAAATAGAWRRCRTFANAIDRWAGGRGPDRYRGWQTARGRQADAAHDARRTLAAHTHYAETYGGRHPAWVPLATLTTTQEATARAFSAGGLVPNPGAGPSG